MSETPALPYKAMYVSSIERFFTVFTSGFRSVELICNLVGSDVAELQPAGYIINKQERHILATRIV